VTGWACGDWVGPPAALRSLQVKTAMMDSANGTISQLKAEVSDLQQEVEDARQAAEAAEARLRQHQEQHSTERSSLRCVIVWD
jgi:predicted  nucleic acid-binding Zn-ribbon protein